MRQSAGGIEPPTFQLEVTANSLPAKRDEGDGAQRRWGRRRRSPQDRAKRAKAERGYGFEPRHLRALPKEPHPHCPRKESEEIREKNRRGPLEPFPHGTRVSRGRSLSQLILPESTGNSGITPGGEVASSSLPEKLGPAAGIAPAWSDLQGRHVAVYV